MSPTGPFVVSLLEVQRALGTRRQAEVRGPMQDVAITDARLPDGAEVVADITVESTTGQKVTVTGRATAPYVAVCRRCLGPVEGTIEVDLTEIYESRPVEGDTYPLTKDWLDLGPMLRDNVLLSLPVAALCRPDCPGPEPEAFPVAKDGDDDPAEESAGPPRDPRWAVLDELRLDDPP